MKPINYLLLLCLFVALLSCKKKSTDGAKDSTAPVISLNGSENMDIDKGVNTSDPGATATDETDGDLSSLIESDWNDKVNTNANGQYVVTYKVKDKSGNEATKTRNVTVKFGSGGLLGVYSATWTSGGSAVTGCTIVPGNSSNEFIVHYLLGPGGPQFAVQRSGIFGDQLSVNEQISQSLSLTGTGNINGAGTVITLNMTQHYTISGDTPISVVMAKQ
jgi:hypothetical protein